MIAYRYTIEGEVTAANAAEAYDVLTEVVAQIAESLGLYAPQVELKKEITITLVPLRDPYRTAVQVCRAARQVVGAGGALRLRRHICTGGTDG
jgi:hypothetical protein